MDHNQELLEALRKEYLDHEDVTKDQYNHINNLYHSLNDYEKNLRYFNSEVFKNIREIDQLKINNKKIQEELLKAKDVYYSTAFLTLLVLVIGICLNFS